jgi:hypothetical protein
MITERQREKLRQLFGAYFHQDWDRDFGTPDNALSAFIRDKSGQESEFKELADSIRDFAREYASDDELTAALFKELGCEYFPPGHGVSTRVWLQDVAAKLEGGKGS